MSVQKKARRSRDVANRPDQSLAQRLDDQQSEQDEFNKHLLSSPTPRIDPKAARELEKKLAKPS